MFLTEEEAKTKWCAFTRYQVHDNPSENRWKQSLPADEPHAVNPVACRCIASACMSWRWTRNELKTTGYCGLAGKPDRKPQS